MRQLLSPEDIANDIRMTRSQHRGAFVLVEGEIADLRVFDRLVDRSRCRVEPAHGKANVLDVVAILEADDFPGILGIVDVDPQRLVLDRRQLVRTILSRTLTNKPQKNLDEAWFLEELDRLATHPDIPARDLSNGHDMVQLLSVGLRRVLGSRKKSEVTPDVLERDLRLAYEREYFRSSGLYGSIRDWERRNSPFTVLGEE